MKTIKHPTQILTEAEAIVISSSIISSIAIFVLSIAVFCFKHCYFLRYILLKVFLLLAN